MCSSDLAVMIACCFRFRYINAGYYYRVFFNLLLEEQEKQNLSIDFDNPDEVARRIKELMVEVNAEEEPVKVRGKSTMDIIGAGTRPQREQVKIIIDADPERRDLFYKIANYPEVRKAIHEKFLKKLVSGIRVSGKYKGVVIFATEPFDWEKEIVNIMLRASDEIASGRARWPLWLKQHIDRLTYREGFGPHFFPGMRIFEIDTGVLTSRQAYFKARKIIQGHRGKGLEGSVSQISERKKKSSSSIVSVETLKVKTKQSVGAIKNVGKRPLSLFSDSLLEWITIKNKAPPINLLAGSSSSSVSAGITFRRSEERRVGKECRSRWSPYH